MLKLKFFGVALGLLGNLAVGIAIYNMVGTGSCGGELPACPDSLTPSFILLPAGIIISTVAIFFGGGGIAFIGLFLAIGIGSFVSGLESESDEMSSFALIFGGGFIGVPLLILGVGAFATRKTVAKVKRTTRLVETGARGIGTVTSVSDTGMTINDNPRVEIFMRVDPEDHSPSFDVSKKVTVSRVAIPRAGDRFPVFYDPANHKNWGYGTDADLRQVSSDIAALFEKARGLSS